MGTTITAVALFAAVFLVGPVLRMLLGNPVSWHQDFTCRDAILQAWAAQTFSLTTVLFVTGLLWALVAARHGAPKLHPGYIANFLTIAAGCVAFTVLMKHRSLPWEYFGAFNGALLPPLAPFLFAPCTAAGASIAGDREMPSKKKHLH